MSTRADTRRYSPEELLAMSDGDRYELADGRLVERTGGRLADAVGGRLRAVLAKFLSGKRLGLLFAGADASYDFIPGRHTLRRPAVSFVTAGRAPKGASGHLQLAPDLAVEVVSAEDAYEAVAGKVDDSLRAGTRLVWLLRPEVRSVRVYRAGGTWASLGAEDELDGEDVLPGLRLAVRDIFPQEAKPARGARAAARAPVPAGKDGAVLAAAIRAEPDEDLPRLAYADWCEENGDPDYAEFVRAQVELARRPWDDPERPRLLDQEARFRPAALARYQAAVPASHQLSFVRGFPAADIVATRVVELGAKLHQAGPVLHLHLTSLKSRTRETSTSPALEGLPSLSLANNALTGEGLVTVLQSEYLRDLVALDLWSTSLGPMAVRELASLRWPRLRRLSVAKNRGRSQLFQALARAPWLGQITDLNLAENPIGEKELVALVQAGDLGKLEALDLTRLGLQDADAFARFLAHPRLGRLRRLALGGWGNSSAHLAALASAPSLADLGELAVVDYPTTAGGLATLASSPCLARLNTLDLRGSVQDDGSLRALGEGRGLAALTTLRLGCQSSYYQGQVTAAGLAEFLRSPFVKRLRRLVVYWPQLGEGWLPALRSPHLAGLVELDLTWCRLSAAGLRALVEGGSLSGLRCLRLVGNHVDEEVVGALLDSRPELRELTLGGLSQLAEETRAALRERFGAGVLAGW